MNTEGRVQHGYRALFSPGEAREDWRILRAFSEVIGKPLPYNDINGVRDRMAVINPVFARVGLQRFGCTDSSGPRGGDKPEHVGDMPFRDVVSDYYLSNPISRASLTMAECARLAPSALVDRTLAVAAE